MEEELTQVFNNFLDNFEASQLHIPCGCWFLEDFSRFSRSFAQIIISRILTPPISPISHYEQPVLPLFYLIDAVCKSCGQVYCGIFAERLPQLFTTSLRRGDDHLKTKLIQLIRHWGTEGIFNEGIIDLLGKTAQGDLLEEPAIQAEPTPQPAQMYEPWLYAFSASDQREVASAPTTERRFARNWMRGAVEWETLLPQSELLIVDLDVTDEPVARAEAFGYVIVTAENENERCVKCTGHFDVVQGPTGENAFKGVVRIPRVGYMHQECYEHDQSVRLFGPS
jgi:hypothetical protein